jgi:hypothetical protein
MIQLCNLTCYWRFETAAKQQDTLIIDHLYIFVSHKYFSVIKAIYVKSKKIFSIIKANYVKI